MNILVLVGSLRAGSWTRELVATVPGLLPAGVEARVYDGLAELPHYDQDLDGDAAPASVRVFREALAAADALVVATPEYNGSIPGVLKNAVDLTPPWRLTARRPARRRRLGQPLAARCAVGP